MDEGQQSAATALRLKNQRHITRVARSRNPGLKDEIPLGFSENKSVMRRAESQGAGHRSALPGSIELTNQLCIIHSHAPENLYLGCSVSDKHADTAQSFYPSIFPTEAGQRLGCALLGLERRARPGRLRRGLQRNYVSSRRQ